MFFMMGITDGRKNLNFTQTVICNICGKYGRYQVFMTYTVLSLFFIPCFKWNRHYYVQTTCCHTLYELDPEIGRAIARGEQPEIMPRHLTLVRQQSQGEFGIYGHKRCENCGYETDEDFEYCPKCGKRF